jgi:hypothetical protein
LAAWDLKLLAGEESAKYGSCRFIKDLGLYEPFFIVDK